MNTEIIKDDEKKKNQNYVNCISSQPCLLNQNQVNKMAGFEPRDNHGGQSGND